MVLKGRLGLKTARVPYKSRHGLLWLTYGNVYIKDGALKFKTAGSKDLEAGTYGVPNQKISMLLLGPGSTITHDCLRILAKAGTGVIGVGKGGVRMYTFPPVFKRDSEYARKQAYLWANKEKRISIARKMYKRRMGSSPPDNKNINELRGIEGARIKEVYKIEAKKNNINWNGRRYNRQNPSVNDAPNQAINHIATAMEGAAMIAVAATGTIPQLGFIHEDAGISFCLDVADLHRTEVVVSLAFKTANKFKKGEFDTIDRAARYMAAKYFKKHKIIPCMIDEIKELLKCQ